jgi:excisionase family DNA binding protein
MSELLTVQEAAELLRVNPFTLYSWVSKRRIPYVKVGRKTLFNLSDLETFIKDNTFDCKLKVNQ